jgi:cob(I)alamin adenosyltransferase
MSKRLTRIVTRTGDTGETGLAGGARLPKDHARIEVIGAVDELNSVLGLLLAETLPDDLRQPILDIQHDLFDLGGEISMPGTNLLRQERIAELEGWVERRNADLPPLKEFILPGGSRAAALAHMARTVCRRAERRLVSLARAETVTSTALVYLNRLSDLLFVLARVLNRAADISDVFWRHERRKPASGDQKQGFEPQRSQTTPGMGEVELRRDDSKDGGGRATQDAKAERQPRTRRKSTT